MAYLLPSLSGILFALIGFAYRRAQSRGLPTTAVVVYMAGIGALVFSAKALLGDAAFGDVPARVWVLAVASGFFQYATIKFAGWALARGPLSPMWCALNLVFVPVIAYAAIFLGESVDAMKAIGVACAVASVVVGSLAGGGGEGGAKPRGLSATAVYSAILVGALLSNSVLHGSLKDLGAYAMADGRMAIDAFGDHYLGVMYFFMAAPTAIELAIEKRKAALSPFAVGTGLLAAVGSLGGVWFLALASSYPAAIVFTLSAVLSLVGGALSSVFFFGERASPTWFAMMGLAVGSVVLVSV